MSTVVLAEGLTKRFRDVTAVDGINFSVQKQEVFGFLGPNGAGKTTTMKMIYCVVPVTAGKLIVGGKDVKTDCRAIKAMLGVVPQENNLDPDLTVLQNLLVYSRYFDIPRKIALERIMESLELFQLLDRQNSRIDTLSGGMKRRLIIARALVNQPIMLILDEPTTGLDPQARHLVWQKLRYLKSQGVTMLLSTHYMDEAAQLCDRLVIMHQGKILAEGSPSELIAKHVGPEALEVRVRPEAKEEVLRRLRGHDIVVEDVEDTLYIFGKDGELLRREVTVDVEKLVQRKATLEDVFLKLTGRGLQE